MKKTLILCGVVTLGLTTAFAQPPSRGFGEPSP